MRLERAGESIALIDQALTRFTPTPNDLLYPALFSLLGFAWVLCGAPSKGVELIRRSIDAAEALGLMVRRSQQATWLAEGLMASGRTAEAENVAREAVARAVACHEHGHQAWALRTLARTLQRRDPPVAAQIERTASALAVRHGLLTLLRKHAGKADPLTDGPGAGDVVAYPEGGRSGRVSRA